MFWQKNKRSMTKIYLLLVRSNNKTM